MLGAKRIRQSTRVVLHLSLRLGIRRRISTMVPWVGFLVGVSVFAPIDEAGDFWGVALCLRAERPINDLPLERALTLVSELELVGRADIRGFISIHRCSHQL